MLTGHLCIFFGEGFIEGFFLTVIFNTYMYFISFPDGAVVKNIPAVQELQVCNAGDLGLIPGLGRSPGGGNGNPLQYSCLEKSMDRGAWRATVLGGPRNWTWLSH